MTIGISYANIEITSDTETDSNFVRYFYKYVNNNILSISVNGSLYELYSYDDLNQLSQVLCSTSTYFFKDVYTYDDGGNITRVKKTRTNKRTFEESTLLDVTYSYSDSDWGDLLTKYGSYTITYDGMGNPLNYRNGMTMTWERGRLLSTVKKLSTMYKYKYDANGLRTSKCTVTSDTDSDKYEYFYDDNSNLVLCKTPYGDLYFIYDESDSIIGVRHVTSTTDKMYSYIKNLQGDIMMLTDETGAVVAKYKYDVFGKVESVTTARGTTISSKSNIGLLNPIRYRGYCYDNETGLYYLISRYYDPTTGRFVNADIYCDTNTGVLGTNMFAYCYNNPVMATDPMGTDAYWLQDKNAVDLPVLGKCGHTSLLIQEAPGKWWYFYWGDKDIQLLYFGSGNLKKLNEFLNGKNNWKYKFYDGKYDKWNKMKGNFTYCLNVIYSKLMGSPKGKKIVSYSFAYCKKGYKNKNYNVAIRNCVQVSIFVLTAGKFSRRHNYKVGTLINSLGKGPIPNVIYDYLLLNLLFL